MENQIIELIREGKSNKEIAYALNSTEQAIKDRIHRLLRKHNCKNRVQLAVTVPQGTIER
jgi:two-component system nitrate/nitrite response regulator NarP